jgi:ferric-dicitrate binding protein FerR (iron transport regulator)
MTERKIYDVMMDVCKSEGVPDGYYGPGTVRWATNRERELKLADGPLVHLDADGKIDCYFTETQAVIVRRQA